MTSKQKSPIASLAATTRTKILATIGPATDSYDKIFELVAHGVDGFRLNFSHGSHDERLRQIGWIRKASAEQNLHVAIVQDLQGPKIRLGDFDGVFNVKRGQELMLVYGSAEVPDNALPVQFDLSKRVKRGEPVLLYDGTVKAHVTSVRPSESAISIKIENDGVLLQRKGINLPETDFSGEIITKKDRQDVIFGSENDIDYVALSFVQTANDVKELRQILNRLGSEAKIITKVETQKAIEHIDEIIDVSDGIMIARGDLAVETRAESVPVLQRNIIGKCIAKQKLSIVATQMMLSMMEAPEPTRAEVSDVATAAIVGADAAMLSDETANGRYPVETVTMMEKILRYTQENSHVRALFTDDEARRHEITEALADAIVNIANKVSATAIVAETQSGTTARYISAQRSRLPLITVTPNARVAQQLALLYGAVSFLRPANKMAATRLTDWLLENKVLAKGNSIVTASGKYASVGGTDTIKVRVLE